MVVDGNSLNHYAAKNHNGNYICIFNSTFYKMNTNYNISKVEYRSIKRSIGKNKYVNVPYELLVLGFEKALKNMQDRVGACESVMDIVVTQMSVGKSTCTDTDLRRLVKKYLPQIQLILRLSLIHI